MGGGSGEGNPAYRRVLLKLSGEALAGDAGGDIDPDIIGAVAREIREVCSMGIAMAIVIGAGNIFRGSMAGGLGIDRVTGDSMGMLATVMNSLALKSVLQGIGAESRVLSALEMPAVAEFYTVDRAREHLDAGRVVIVAGGTGHPFFTTDTAAALRAMEIGADVLLKATKVDGVYTADPEKDASAERFEEISYIDVIKNNLRVMDLTAVSLCMDGGMPLVVFNLFNKGALKRIVSGGRAGTLIS
ncbi:MAG: UMP kinase [Spirochaetes bacterium]|nr:UMP kinase [Spirochaetota bacterium]